MTDTVTSVEEIIKTAESLTETGKLEEAIGQPGILLAALREISMHGFCDEESGDVDTYLWFARIDRWILTCDSQGFYNVNELMDVAAAKQEFAAHEQTYLGPDDEEIDSSFDAYR